MAVALEDEPQAGNVALRIVDRRSQTAVENHVVVDLNKKQAKSGRKGDEKIKRTRKPAGWLSKDTCTYAHVPRLVVSPGAFLAAMVNFPG